jgi:LEA14-like dessication related protein
MQAEPAPDCTAGVKDVKVAFVDQELLDASFRGATLRTLWRVVNPGEKPITLTRWGYALTFTGKTMPADEDPVVTVEPHQCAQVRFSARIDYPPPSKRGTSSRSYTAKVSPVVGERTFKAEHSESINLPEIPRPYLLDLKTSNDSVSATVKATFAVSNENRFPVALQELQADVLLYAQKLGHVKSGPQTLPPRSKATIDFETRIELMNIGGMARAALQTTEDVSLDLKGMMLIEGDPIPVAWGGMVRPR